MLIPEEEEDHANILNAIMHDDYVLCAEFGLILHPRKCFCSGYTLFLEEYSHPEFRDKSTSFAANFGHAFASPSIGFAKEYANANIHLSNERFAPIMSNLISFWGYEFDNLEHTRDYYLGGWTRRIHRYMTMIHHDLAKITDEEAPYYCAIQEAIKLRHIYKNTSRKFDREAGIGKAIHSVLATTYGITLKDVIPEDISGPLEEIFGSDQENADYYDKLSKKLSKPTFFFNRYERIRKKIKERKFKTLSKEDLIQNQMEYFSDDTYSLPEEYVTVSTDNFDSVNSIGDLPNLKGNDQPIEHLLSYLEVNNYIRMDKSLTRASMAHKLGYDVTSTDLSEGAWATVNFEKTRNDVPDFAYAFAQNPFITISEYIIRVGSFPCRIKYDFKPIKPGFREFCRDRLRQIAECPKRGILQTELYLAGFELEDEFVEKLSKLPHEILHEVDNEEDEEEQEKFCSDHRNGLSTMKYHELRQDYVHISGDPNCELCMKITEREELLSDVFLNAPEASERHRIELMKNQMNQEISRYADELGLQLSEIDPRQCNNTDYLEDGFDLFGNDDEDW